MWCDARATIIHPLRLNTIFPREAIKAIDPFRVDPVLAGGSPFALEERGDPPVAVGWPLVEEATDIGGQFDIARPDLWSPCRASSLLTLPVRG